MKDKDYKSILGFIEETSIGIKDLSKQKKFQLPFRIYRIQIKPNTNVHEILVQIEESFFDNISTAYNYDNVYFFVVPEDFELIIETLKNINPEIIETIGAVFFEKIEIQNFLFNFFLII